jgi:hypothetical protein
MVKHVITLRSDTESGSWTSGNALCGRTKVSSMFSGRMEGNIVGGVPASLCKVIMFNQQSSTAVIVWDICLKLRR